MSEENQNVENITTEENPVSAEPKEEISESVPSVTEVVEDKPVVENLEVEKPIEQVEISEPEIVDEVVEEKVEETASSLAETTTEEIPQIETPTQEVEQPLPTPIQEIQPKPEIQTVEKIVYKTDPNLIQNLLNKARAKIQERKKIKLDKIMKLFESNPDISNSDIQNLLRTTKRSATRYLNILEKEQKITQVGNAGRSVKYIKKQ